MPVPQVNEPTLNREQYRRVSWDDLLAEGAVVRRQITAGEVAAAVGTSAPEVPLGRPTASTSTSMRRC